MSSGENREELERELRSKRPGAIEAASAMVNLMLAKTPDGSPNWQMTKEAAMALRGFVEDGSLMRLVDDVIAEAEEEGAE